MVGETEVLIRWPMMYDGGSQSYLLYLMSATMDTGESCSIIDNEFNPEDLKVCVFAITMSHWK